MHLRRSNASEKFAYLVIEIIRLLRQLAGGIENLIGFVFGCHRRVFDGSNGVRYFVGTGRGLFDILGDVTGCDSLLFDGRRNCRRNLIHFHDDRNDASNCLDRVLRGVPNLRDLHGDFFGCLCCLRSERLHLAGHHRKTSAGFTRTGSLNRGVEGKKVCLCCNCLYEANDITNLLRSRRERKHRLVGSLGLRQGFGCNR